jgi:hypothetical protein
MLCIGLIFASIAILPILFCLKADGTLGKSVPWLAIWTPFWIVDIVLLFASIFLFLKGEDKPEGDEENQKKKEEEKIPLSEKIYSLITTVLFVLIQIFVLMGLDKVVDWSWFTLFIPWFIYEFFLIGALLKPSFTPIPPPNHDKSLISFEDGADHDEEILLHKLKLEHEYFTKTIEQKNSRKTIAVYLLRFWLAIFLALKIDHKVNWNWGLVLLPIWVYFVLQYQYISHLRYLGAQKAKVLNPEEQLDSVALDPEKKLQLEQSRSLYSESSSICFLQFWILFMSVLLVCRLQLSSYSTFIIIIPVFLVIFCCCCVVFSGICGLSMMDPDDTVAGAGGGEYGSNSEANMDHKKNIDEENANFIYSPPIISIIDNNNNNNNNNDYTYTENVEIDNKNNSNNVEYGTFATNENKSPLQVIVDDAQKSNSNNVNSKTAVVAPTMIEMDID